MSFPLTETEIAVRVYAHPLIAAYDKAISKLHARHTAAYGPDFMDEPVIDERTGIDTTPRGVKRWTEHEETVFNNLYRAARTMRAEKRSKVSQ